MIIAKNLRVYLFSILRYLGNGYIYIKLVKIPKAKLLKKDQILKKIEAAYNTNTTSGKRQYNKKKGLANYAAIAFLEYIIILRTPGKHNDSPAEFVKFRGSFDLVISEHLTLVLFKDNRGKLTYRLSRDNFLLFKENIRQAYIKKNGYKYNHNKKLFNSLQKLKYNGIIQQKNMLNIYIKELQKKHRIKGWGLL